MYREGHVVNVNNERAQDKQPLRMHASRHPAVLPPLSCITDIPLHAVARRADDAARGAVPRPEEGPVVAVGRLGGEAPPRVPQDEPCRGVPGE